MQSGDASIVRQDTPSVVNISTWKVLPSTQPGEAPRRVKVYASGFVMDPSGIIITNKHVIDGALGLTAIFSNGDRVPAHLLVAAQMLDLAVLKVDVDHPLPALKWGDSDALQVGDPVLTMGNQLGIGLAVSAGIVSGLNRDLMDSPFDSYIQTDATINHGNSGGPLIDANGNVVGIDTALYNPDENGGFIGIGFAIPSNTAKFVVEFLLNPNHPKPGWLGVTLQDMNEDLAAALDAPHNTGAIISEVTPGSPASQASLQIGDVVESINGTPLSDSRAFNRAVVMLPVGSQAHLTIWRGGKQQDVTTSVAAWPNYMRYGGMMHGAMAQAMRQQAPDPGVKLAEITEADRKQYGLDPTLTGALVTSVEKDCEAADLGIVPGDVVIDAQGEPVSSPADVRRALQEAHEQQRPYLAILVHAAKATRWVSLSISAAGS
jgi:serine protease Do